MRRIAPLLAAAASLAGCGATLNPSTPPGANILTVALLDQRLGTISAVIVDQTHLVVDARKAIPRQPPDRLDFAMAHPETNTLDIWWFGGVCRFGPSIRLSGTADQITVTLRPEDGGTLPPGMACDAVGITYGVELTLSTPVQQADVDFELVR